MEEPYDHFLFGQQARVFEASNPAYDFDLLQATAPFFDPSQLQGLEYRLIDHLMNLISNEGKNYLLNSLSYGSAYAQGESYDLVRKRQMKENMRQVLLLTSRLIARGDPYNLLLDLVEDVQHARLIDQTDPCKLRRLHQKKSDRDLGQKLLNNLSEAYKHHCKDRNEKKRILSIAATEVSYKEGSQLFACGYSQFCNAKKLAKRFGHFAEPIDDEQIIADFIAANTPEHSEQLSPQVLWEQFQITHPDVAIRTSSDFFLQACAKEQDQYTSSNNSAAAEEFAEQALMDSLLLPEDDISQHFPQFLQDSDISMVDEPRTPTPDNALNH